MKTSVQRWGNSLALKIPREFAAKITISAGSKVEITLKSGLLMIRPVVRKRDSLAELLKRVTRNNRHDAFDTKQAVGKEVWG